MKDNVTHERYEFKYLLRHKVSEEIKHQVNHFMEIDQFAKLKSNKEYFIRSIYFEDDFNSNFDEKVNGFKIRKKFRIRYYGKDQNNSPLYLEAKGRNLERTYKRRIKIDETDIELIKKKDFLYKLVRKYPSSHIINEFVFESYRKKLKPKVVIDYNRSPYVNKYGLYFRLTFDQNISCIKLNDNFGNLNKNHSVLCEAGYTILEVKFDRSIPAWFHRIIQSYDLRRQSISKFVLGMTYSKLGEETSD
mgnify:FL=1|jgi:hypothetical protein